jgi:hypothetical protein
MQIIRNLAVVFFIGALAVGCAKVPPKEARVPEGARTKSAEAVEHNLIDLKKSSSTLKGLAWIELYTEAEDWRTEAAVVLGRPGRIRIDAMDSLADVWAQMGTDGRDLWLYIPGKKKLYRESASSRNMKRLSSFEWEPADLISLIAGTPPVADEPMIVQVGSGQDAHFVDRSSRLHIWTERGKHKQITRCVRYAETGDNIDFEARFSQYKVVHGVEFPHSIEAVFPSRKARLKIEYREITLGGDVALDVFEPPKRHSNETVKLGGKKR